MPKMLAVATELEFFATTPAFAQEFDPMQFADADHDGKVMLAEYTTFQEGGWNFVTQSAAQVKPAEVQGPGQGLFMGIATDANGVLTKEAFMAFVPTRFKQVDANGDGTIDETELRASFGMPPK